MRREDRHQPLGETRVFSVDFELHASGQEGEAFEQALHVGVGALELVEPQAPGDLGKVLGELASQLAQVRQLAVVVGEEPPIQATPLDPSRRKRWPHPSPSSDPYVETGAAAGAAPTTLPRSRRTT